MADTAGRYQPLETPMILNPYRYASESIDFGTAYRDFDGTNDYIEIPAAMGTALSGNSITITSWVYLRSTANGEPILCEGFTGSSTVAISHGAADTAGNNHWQSGIYNSGWDSTAVESPTLNTWVNVATVYDGATLELYIDGTLAQSASTTKSMTPEHVWYIGKHWSQGRYIDARISDLRIFDGADSTEVTRAANGQSPSSSTLAWFLKNSDDVSDHSGNGYNGTNNGTTYSATGGPLD